MPWENYNDHLHNYISFVIVKENMVSLQEARSSAGMFF